MSVDRLARTSRSWSPGPTASSAATSSSAWSPRAPDVRAFCLYNSRGSAGWLDEVAGGRPRRARHPPRRHPRRRASSSERRDGRRGRVPPRGADRDPVLVRRAGVVRRHERRAARSTCSRRPRAAGVRRLIQTSTSEVYGTPETLPIRETHPLNAQSPYAATKVAADQLALAFQRSASACRSSSCGRSTRTARASRSARSCRRCSASCWPGGARSGSGRLDPRRDLTFVADTVDGFVRAAAAAGHRRADDPARHGPDASRIGELFELACRLHRRATRAPVADAARLRPDASEVLVLQSDPSLARELLGWRGDHGARGRASRRRSSGCGRSPTSARTSTVSSSDGSPSARTADPARRADDRRQRAAATSTSASARTSSRRSGRSSPGSSRRSRPFVGSRYAVACASGTAAIHLAMLVLDVGGRRRGPRPDLTFVASANPVRVRRRDAGPRRRGGARRSTSIRRSSSAELDRRARAGLARSRRRSRSCTSLGHPADIEPIVDAAGRVTACR